MAEIKWVKIPIDIFSNERIKFIESKNDGDTIIITLLKMITHIKIIDTNGSIGLKLSDDLVKVLGLSMDNMYNYIEILRYLKIISIKDNVIIVSSEFFKIDNECMLHDILDYNKRMYILQRDHYTCAYCGALNSFEVDHIFPKSRGGSDHESNLTTSCKHCNSSKKDRTVEEWNNGKV